MSSRRSRRSSHAGRPKSAPLEPGRLAQGGGIELRSYDVGALPLVNQILDRMDLEGVLGKHLPPDDPRTELPTAQVLLVMVRNLLLSREPIYGVGEWAAGSPPTCSISGRTKWTCWAMTGSVAAWAARIRA